MIHRSLKQTRPRSSTGFSLVELVIVVAIALIVMAIAIPGIRRSLQFYSLRSGITSVTGAIQSTRYQAIFHGCRYQIVFSAAAYSYTVANQVPAAGNSTCTGVYGAPGPAIPIMGRGVALGATTTMQFFPNGTIVTVPATAPMTLNLTYTGSSFPTETITVSTYGKINVTP